MCTSIRTLILSVLLQILSCGNATKTKKSQPNLIVVMTDEQNYRTLGCYRDQLEEGQKDIWGEGVKVDTPYIDSLAKDGAMYTNFFSASPLCTPARASFVTGLYPSATGASSNKLPLNKDSITFAEILSQNGYQTGYFGKWHLNGEAKPGFTTKVEDKFGFKDTRYMFNRGHWKYFRNGKDGTVIPYEWNTNSVKRFKYKEKRHYATDFLFDKAIDYIKEKSAGDDPFAIMLSIPDPHNPTNVRKPYSTMYNDMKFKVPETSFSALRMQPGLPLWSNLNIVPKIFGTRIKEVRPSMADIRRKRLLKSELRQKTLRETFGMIKLVDDNMGKLLRLLKKYGIGENTIVVFTSDHGDMMGEHLRHDKLVPYDTSAGVPFLIRYPEKIVPGKVVKSAHSGTDFTPTILGLMDIDFSIENRNHAAATNLTLVDNSTLVNDTRINNRIPVSFDGFDGSARLLNKRKLVNDITQVRFMTSAERNSEWAAAVTSKYKLVLSSEDVPWLFDRRSDPDEMNNMLEGEFANAHQMKETLYEAMSQYNMPLLEVNAFFWDMPSCGDSHDSFLYKNELSKCEYMTKTDDCKNKIAQNNCPYKCEMCINDSKGKIWLEGSLRKCSSLKRKRKKYCKIEETRKFCPYTCR